MTKQDEVGFNEAEVQFIKKLDRQRIRAESKFPLVTALIATFGFVCLLYGFEKFIDSVDFLSNNPGLLLIIGVVTLGITGTIYKKIG